MSQNQVGLMQKIIYFLYYHFDPNLASFFSSNLVSKSPISLYYVIKSILLKAIYFILDDKLFEERNWTALIDLFFYRLE